MSGRIVAALAAGLMLIGAASTPSNVVSYQLSPVVEGNAITALSVTIHFTGDPSGTTRLSWPDEWAGEANLSRWARAFRVIGASRIEVGTNNARVIYAQPNAPLTVTYRIVSAYRGDPMADETRQALPAVRPGWFYAVGEALFARPEGGGDDARAARFKWTGPRAIGFASDLEQKPRSLTLKDVSESIVIGGRDLHVAAIGAPGHQVRVARLGQYAFNGPAFDALALEVIQAERGFWHSDPNEPFLVTMAPVAAKPGQQSYSGAGRDDAFALWMDTSAPMDGIAWLLGHEYFHTWNIARLGDPLAAPYTAGYWFSEGLTDFYALRLMLRAGLLSPDQFAARWNEKLSAYAGSRYRTAPNDKVAADFWRNEQADAMQYQRGALLAAIWDTRLRAKGTVDGLDAVLHAQAARLPSVKPRPTAIDLFVRIARELGLDPRADIAAHIDRGEPLLLPTDTFGPCAKVVTEERPVFERGWDADRTAAAGNVVTGLDPASAAYAAGLRDGMTLLARVEGKPDDARTNYVLKVRDGAAERLIRFRPAGRRTNTVQELLLDKPAFARDAEICRTSLAGLYRTTPLSQTGGSPANNQH